MKNYSNFINESISDEDFYKESHIDELEIRFSFRDDWFERNRKIQPTYIYYFYKNELIFIYDKPFIFLYTTSKMWFSFDEKHETSKKICKKLIKKYFNLDVRPELPTYNLFSNSENFFNS